MREGKRKGAARKVEEGEQRKRDGGLRLVCMREGIRVGRSVTREREVGRKTEWGDGGNDEGSVCCYLSVFCLPF